MIALLLSIAVALAEPTAQISVSLVLKVVQPETSADRLVAAAADAGGWFAARNDDAVVLRVPTDAVDGLVERAEAEGLVVERQRQRTDVGAAMADLRARIAARREVLAQYFALLPDASSDAVLTVEREIVRVVSEVERLEGTLRVLKHNATYAQVDVAFRFRDRRAPVPDGSSAFPWLNTVDLSTVVYDFAWGDTQWGPRVGPLDALPEGMSRYRGHRELKAASPDGVMYRVRAVRHRPKADLAFWVEALATRMEAAGYVALRDEPVTAATLGDGALLEFTAPLGPDDATYLVGVFVRGRRLVLVEAAGEVATFEARRPAVLEAIRGL